MFKKLVKRFYFINNNYLTLINKLIHKNMLEIEEKEKLENLLNIINTKIINEEEFELENYLIELNNFYNFLYRKTFF